MLSFKSFLVEGGNAVQQYNISRANSEDIKACLKFVSKTLGISYDEIKKDLIGSTELTLLGKKKDSGDVDIAFSLENSDVNSINKKMMQAVNNEGTYNSGTKVGSYAVPVNGKKIQVDLMFVTNKEWAKWIYHSSQGNGSAYPGVVRNIILFTALAHTQIPGQDFVLRDTEGKPIIRASKSINMDSGMKRLFKMSKVNSKTGKYNKSIDTVEPNDIENHLKSIGKNIPFSKDKDFTDNPDDVAKFIFGNSVKGSDLMTAENVIYQIKKLKNADEIINASKKELTRLNLPIPKEL